MPLTTTPIPRELAGSLTLEAPTSSSSSTLTENVKKEILECGGNVQLMEARLCQLTSSMRALLRSNRDLEDALLETPQDPDFLQAITENQLTLRRQGQVAKALVQEMQTRGANVTLEEDIRLVADSAAGGMITADIIFGSEAAPAVAESQTTTESNAAISNDGAGGGMYL